MPASESKLSTLHDKLADQLIERLAGVVETTVIPVGEGGDTMEVTKTIRASAAELAVAAKFLKDNSVTMQPGDDNKLGELRDQINRKKSSFTKADVKDALGKIGSDLLQ